MRGKFPTQDPKSYWVTDTKKVKSSFRNVRWFGAQRTTNRTYAEIECHRGIEYRQRNDWCEISWKILHRPKATIPGLRNDWSLRLTKSMGSISYLVVNLTEGSLRISTRKRGREGREWVKERCGVGGGVGGVGLSGMRGRVQRFGEDTGWTRRRCPASTRILWTYQAILIVSSGCKPADLIILGVPGPRYLRRNERAMAFPGVDSVIGSNSGLVWLRAVLRHRQRRRTLLRDLSNDPSSCLSSTLHLHTRFGLLPLFSERTCSSYRENSSRRLIRAAHCMLLATYLIEDRTFDTIISRRSSSG